ncbi:MAG: hypothetical protein K2L11_03890 [Muribaculaceae bacterium]|nr:hypothetical protein [Muribaculaceae bacterium]
MKGIFTKIQSLKHSFAVLLSLFIYTEDSIHASDQCDLYEELANIGTILDINNLNKLNETGEKIGLWLESDGSFIYITSYTSGKKNGIEKIFHKNDRKVKLYGISIYSSNELKSYILFHDNGMPVGVVYDITAIDSLVCYPENWSEGHIFPYLGYCQDFNEKNGNLMAEGYMIFGEDMELDCERVGLWNIYSQDGSINIKDYGGFKTEAAGISINSSKILYYFIKEHKNNNDSLK